MKKTILLIICFMMMFTFVPGELKAAEANVINIKSAKFNDNKIEIALEASDLNLNLELDYKLDDKKWLSEDFDNLISLKYDTVKKVYTHEFNEEIKFAKTFDVRVRAVVNTTKSNFSNVVTFKSVLNANNYDLWAASSIHKADLLGLVTDSMRQDMKKNATRIEFVESLIKAIEYNMTIKDYENEGAVDTVSESVKKAYKLKLLTYNDKKLFYPDRFITREEVAAILDRLLDRLSAIIEFKVVNDTKVSYDDASDWAKKSIESVVKKGLMIGDKNKKFNPKNNITRQEVLVTVLRVVD